MKTHEPRTELANAYINPLIQCYRRGDPRARERLFAILWRAARSFPLRHGHNGTLEHERFMDMVLERLFPALGITINTITDDLIPGLSGPPADLAQLPQGKRGQSRTPAGHE